MSFKIINRYGETILKGHDRTIESWCEPYTSNSVVSMVGAIEIGLTKGAEAAAHYLKKEWDGEVWIDKPRPPYAGY